MAPEDNPADDSPVDREDYEAWEHEQQNDVQATRGVDRSEENRLRVQLARVRAVLEGIVCTEGVDKGVVMLSDHGPTHPVIVGEKTIQVYDHEYFSPLGDALIAAWKLTLTRATERR